jgi:hypothetical protein
MSDYRSLVAKVYLRWAKCTNQLWIQYWIWCYLIYSKKVIWRRRVGIEPTHPGSKPGHTGFEDQESHQTPSTSTVADEGGN